MAQEGSDSEILKLLDLSLPQQFYYKPNLTPQIIMQAPCEFTFIDVVATKRKGFEQNQAPGKLPCFSKTNLENTDVLFMFLRDVSLPECTLEFLFVQTGGTGKQL